MVRNKIFIFQLLFIFVLTMSGGGVRMDVVEIETKIDAAMSHFFGPATPGADAQMGFIYLIDAIEIAAPHTGFGEEFSGKIKKANSLFKSTSIFNDEGVSLLKEGFSSINSGVAFEMPEEISSIDDARDYARKQVVSAKNYLTKSDYDKCVRLLMEVAVMVVTPRIKKN